MFGERWIISFTHVIYFVIYYPSYVSVLSKKVLVILCHQNANDYEQDYNFFIDHHPVGSPPFSVALTKDDSKQGSVEPIKYLEDKRQ